MPPPKDPVKREEWLKNRRGKKHPLFGKPRPEKTRAKISKSRYGMHRTPESRAKQSQSVSGEKNHNYGKPRLEETRIKISSSLSGEKSIWFGKCGKDHPSFGHRPSEESRKRQSDMRIGEKCHLWKGGLSFEPYPITFNKPFKRFVRNQYGNVCINCRKTQEENGQELTCHHYDYDKNSINCVPVCVSCNGIANGSKDNGSRAFWEDWYTEILSEFY